MRYAIYEEKMIDFCEIEKKPTIGCINAEKECKDLKGHYHKYMYGDK
jgi:hypothetical protein